MSRNIRKEFKKTIIVLEMFSLQNNNNKRDSFTYFQKY